MSVYVSHILMMIRMKERTRDIFTFIKSVSGWETGYFQLRPKNSDQMEILIRDEIIAKTSILYQ